MKYLDRKYTIPLSVSSLFMCMIVVSVALAFGVTREIAGYTVDDKKSTMYGINTFYALCSC